MKKIFITLFVISLFTNYCFSQYITLDTVNIGAAPNDGTGDPLRSAFQKLNANDQEFNYYLPLIVADSMDQMRDYIGDTADILRAEWRSDINDTADVLRLELDSVNYADSALYADTSGYASYSGTSNALNDTITFTDDQYFNSDNNDVYLDMQQSYFVIRFDNTESGYMKIGENNYRCEGFSVAAWKESPDDSIDFIFTATNGLIIADPENVGGGLYAIKFHPDSSRFENWVEINDSLIVEGYIKSDSNYTTKVDSFADYVFYEDYKPITINDKEKFIKKYRHLPSLKSGKELNRIAEKNNGYLTDQEYYRRVEGLVKEVEELTLYVINQNKKIQRLERKLRRRRK